MSTLRPRTNGNGLTRYRRLHRWAGGTLVAFVLFLSVTGLAINHAHDLGLDRRYVTWSWLIDAYGMGRSEPYAGIVELDAVVAVGDGNRVHVLLPGGDLVESIDLGSALPGPIERLGRVGDRVVLLSDGALYRSDADVSVFEPWSDGPVTEIGWSAAIEADAPGLEVLQTAWRGRGVTVERVLLDLHSGRIFSLPGRVFLDIVAIGLILLSISGLVVMKTRRINGR